MKILLNDPPLLKEDLNEDALKEFEYHYQASLRGEEV